MTTRKIITLALGSLAIGLFNGCAARSTAPSHVALSSMEYASADADPLCLASGDSLGMELQVWHVVSTDPDPSWMLASRD